LIRGEDLGRSLKVRRTLSRTVVMTRIAINEVLKTFVARRIW